jgi:CheY-like chemotaxis protein
MSITDSNEVQHKNILVVEDDEGIRETLRLFLELEGYTVFTAVHGKDGLEVLKKIPRPCLILLDLMMPVMNGWEFADEIKKNEMLAVIPVVIVTAYSNKVIPIKASGIIKKPIDLDALLRIVKTSCGEPTGAVK